MGVASSPLLVLVRSRRSLSVLQVERIAFSILIPEDMEGSRGTIHCLFCVWIIANAVAAFPQNPKTFSSVLVTEVDNVDPETKRAFGNGARSILYSSLPEFALDLSNFEEGDIIGEIAVEVETPPLVVTKPKDPEGKLREKAEADRRRPSSNFFTRGLTLLDQI